MYAWFNYSYNNDITRGKYVWLKLTCNQSIPICCSFLLIVEQLIYIMFSLRNSALQESILNFESLICINSYTTIIYNKTGTACQHKPIVSGVIIEDKFYPIDGDVNSKNAKKPNLSTVVIQNSHSNQTNNEPVRS